MQRQIETKNYYTFWSDNALANTDIIQSMQPLPEAQGVDENEFTGQAYHAVGVKIRYLAIKNTGAPTSLQRICLVWLNNPTTDANTFERYFQILADDGNTALTIPNIHAPFKTNPPNGAKLLFDRTISLGKNNVSNGAAAAPLSKYMSFYIPLNRKVEIQGRAPTPTFSKGRLVMYITELNDATSTYQFAAKFYFKDP